jgi:hypothetical protein
MLEIKKAEMSDLFGSKYLTPMSPLFINVVLHNKFGKAVKYGFKEINTQLSTSEIHEV